MSRYTDLTYFKGVLNHELIHAYHISQGIRLRDINSFKGYTERIAYEYSYSIGQASWQQVNIYYPGPHTYTMPPYLIPLP